MGDKIVEHWMNEEESSRVRLGATLVSSKVLQITTAMAANYLSRHFHFKIVGY